MTLHEKRGLRPAVVAAVALGAAASASAANYFWVGATDDGNFSAKANWVGENGASPSGSPVGNSSNQLYFFPKYGGGTKQSFQQQFTNSNFTVKFYSALSHPAKLHFKGAGTAEHPIVFQSKDGTLGYGLTITGGDKGWYIGYDSGDACLALASGKYEASDFWHVGGSSTEGHLTVSAGAFAKSGGNFNVYNGTVDVAGTLDANRIFLARTAGKTAEMTIEGGTVTNRTGAFYVGYADGATGTLHLDDGGTLVTRNLCGQNGTAAVVFNGGTLRAKESYSSDGGLLGETGSMTVVVGEKGGTIDNGGIEVSIGGNCISGSGAVRFAGRGRTSLTVAQSYSGGTFIDAGTVLALNAAAKDALVARDVTVTIPPEGVVDGTVVLEITGGTFTQAEVDSMELSGGDEGRFTLVLAENGAKVKIVDEYCGEYVWNGGASGASWHEAGRWTVNGVQAEWHDSVSAVFASAGDAATLESAATAVSATFRANAAIGGDATLTIPSVVVSNGVDAVVNAPMAGTLAKSGAGTLTLGASRAGATALLEGTLVFSGSGTTAAWNDLEFGSDSPVTLCVSNGAAVAHGGAIRLADVPGANVAMCIADGGFVDQSGDYAFYVGGADGATGRLCLSEGGTLKARNLFHGSGSGEVVFDGGTLRAGKSYANYGGLLAQADSPLAIAITGKGGTIDNGGNSVLVSRDLAGDMSFVGSGEGVTKLAVTQSAPGTLTVVSGTVATGKGVDIGRPTTVKGGATLAIDGSAQSSFADIAFEPGSTLNINSCTVGVVPMSVTLLALPSSGAVTLRKDGAAFPKGLYPVLTRTGASAAAFEALVPAVEEGAFWRYFVKNDTLYLSVDTDMTGFVWAGFAGDGRMSSDGNWWNGTAPGNGDSLDFSSVVSPVEINADIEGVTFGAVTFGESVVTFAGNIAASSFSDTSKIAVGANATVTVDGDLMFYGTAGDIYVLDSIGEGGKFVVTGLLGLGAGCTDRLFPLRKGGSGTIVAGGLCNNAEKWMFATSNGGSVKWVVGSHGAVGTTQSAGFWTYSNASSEAEFQANTNDFEIALRTCLRTSSKGVTLNTTGYGDGAAHTIALNAGYYDNGGPLVIAGKGRVLCNATATGTVSDGTARYPYSGEVRVSDTATLSVKPGETLTAGPTTVGSGAAFEVAGSGTVAPGGDLAFADGATLKFNFTERKAAPVIDLTGASLEEKFLDAMRVGSCNIRCINATDTGDRAWDARKGSLAALVVDIGFDAVGFQEVTEGQKTYLNSNLTGYALFAGEKSRSSEYLPVAYKTARFDRIGGGTFWLSATPDKPSQFSESTHDRICTWVLLRDKKTRGKILFANTHLDLAASVRPKQMRVVMDFLSEHVEGGVQPVLVGDMNCDEREETISIAANALCDSALQADSVTGPWRTYNAWKYVDPAAEPAAGYALTLPVSSRNPLDGGSRIDYVFGPKYAQVVSYAVCNDTQPGKEAYPSDHYPVYADLTLPIRNLAATGSLRVQVSKDCQSVAGGQRFVLTNGAGLQDAGNIIFDMPKWVKSATVEDGEIVICTKPDPLFIRVR